MHVIWSINRALVTNLSENIEYTTYFRNWDLYWIFSPDDGSNTTATRDAADIRKSTEAVMFAQHYFAHSEHYHKIKFIQCDAMQQLDILSATN